MFKTPEQEERAMAERRANEEAKQKGEPLPFPNLWDFLDPTKVPEDASPQEISLRYREFCKICPPRKRIHYTV
ncbi:MAG: hypothetical protein AB1758_09750 [Candidatus Eremiobacterota bacterium]